MKLHFYGTGASEGFPALFCECEHCKKAKELGGKNIRTRTSCQLDEHILIDFSADSYAHILYSGLDLTKINHLFITHSHEDHFYMADLTKFLPPMAWYSRERYLRIYGNNTVHQIFDNYLGKRKDVKAGLTFEELVEGHGITVEDYSVTPLLANHDKSENCFLYVIQREGKTLLYGHDSAMFSEYTWEQMKQYKFNCVILDCTSAMEHNIFDIHMSFEDNKAIRERMLSINLADENTLFIATHFAHTYAPFYETLTEQLAEFGFIAAYDGMEVEF